MTRDEILNHPAGRELDALVQGAVPGASRLFGACPSTDIRGAWNVVEALCGTGREFVGNTGPLRGNDIPIYSGMYYEVQSMRDGWFVCFGEEGGIPSSRRGSATAPTFPLAVCRAALMALGVAMENTSPDQT